LNAQLSSHVRPTKSLGSSSSSSFKPERYSIEYINNKKKTGQTNNASGLPMMTLYIPSVLDKRYMSASRPYICHIFFHKNMLMSSAALAASARYALRVIVFGKFYCSSARIRSLLFTSFKALFTLLLLHSQAKRGKFFYLNICCDPILLLSTAAQCLVQSNATVQSRQVKKKEKTGT